MRTERISNETDLLEKLAGVISSSDKREVVFMTGHFPLVYDSERRLVVPDFSRKWGPFPLYSLTLAASLASMEIDGKESKFALIADDHTYAPTETRNWIFKPRNEFYQTFSGSSAILHPKQKNILRAFGLDETNVMRFDHGKDGREECLYGSENVLIATRKNRLSENVEELNCSRAYAEFLDSHVNPAEQYLVSFIPNKCMANVCRGVLGVRSGISGAHVFCNTDFDSPLNHKLSVEDLYKEGITLRLD